MDCAPVVSKLIADLYDINLRVSGYMMTEKLVVPRRSVKKDWHVGLDPDPVDRSHPDVHDDQLVSGAVEKKSVSRKLMLLPNSKIVCICG